MKVSVYSPKNKLFDQISSKSVYLPGQGGDLQVFDNHIPVLVALRPGDIIVEKSNGERLTLEVDAGYAQFAENKMTIVVVDTQLSEAQLQAIEQKAIEGKDKTIRAETEISEEEFLEMEQSERNVGKN